MLSYRLLFCLRRILFVSSIWLFDKTPTYQLLSLLYVNLVIALYIGLKPFKSLITNRIELANEYMMTSICYSSIVATDYLVKIEQKYEGAWVMIAFISFMMLVNIVLVVCFVIHNFKLTCLKYGRILIRGIK